MNIKIKLYTNGSIPVFKHKSDACADCFSAETKVVKAHSRELISLGFAIQLPRGYEAVIRPRSGLSKNGIDVAIGTIDEGYTGVVCANVINNTDEDFTVLQCYRICQIAIRKTHNITFKQVAELGKSERGSDGFGSTGF